VRRAAGIVVYALSDAMMRCEWVSTGSVAGPQLVSDSSRRDAQNRTSAAGGFTRFVVAALIVVVVAVVANTVLFSATSSRHTYASTVAGIGGVTLLVASVVVGAIAVCAGPRWRRNRRRGA
jgi:hypothetical protein